MSTLLCSVCLAAVVAGDPAAVVVPTASEAPPVLIARDRDRDRFRGDMPFDSRFNRPEFNNRPDLNPRFDRFPERRFDNRGPGGGRPDDRQPRRDRKIFYF